MLRFSKTQSLRIVSKQVVILFYGSSLKQSEAASDRFRPLQTALEALTKLLQMASVKKYDPVNKLMFAAFVLSILKDTV